MQRTDLKTLQTLAQPAAGHEATWRIEAETSIDFLRANAGADEIIIFATAPSVLIVGALVPTANVQGDRVAMLEHIDLFTDARWKVQKSWSSAGHRVYLEPPFPEDEALAGGEPLLHRRVFQDVEKGPATTELSQKLIHSLDLYFVSERRAYCRLDKHGDIEDVIRLLTLPIDDNIEGREVVTILRKDLDEYMALADMALVIKFDFTRFTHGDFGSWNGAEVYSRAHPDLFYHGGVIANASYANGAMVVRANSTVQEQEDAWLKEVHGDGDREFATFKIHDRKHDRNVETSCGPSHIVSYFEDSPLPWEISPAFFRPEVLNRFKGDPEKYSVEERSISCRGAWSLRSYDINEAGQVHAYLVDLARLPHAEQTYWKTFNEWPKGPISARAQQTDIDGSWDTGYDPLRSLKSKIRDLNRQAPAWWSPRGDELLDGVLAPATDSPKEWGDEVLALDQLLVEGFLDKPLRAIATASGRTLEDGWRSMKLLSEILEAGGMTATDAKQLLDPMKKLHGLRNEIRGHATKEKREVAIREARATHGNFRAQFFSMAEGCDKALDAIVTVLSTTTSI